MYFPNTKYSRLFLAVALIQGLLALGLQAYVFVAVMGAINPIAAYATENGHLVPMYFSLFIFAFVYELIVVYDALRLRSMIQLVGICIFSFLLLIYAAVQPLQVKATLDQFEGSHALGSIPLLPPKLHTWQRIAPALIAVILVQAMATFALAFLTYKLHFEFAWVVYKVVHADLLMKKRLLNFQIYIALIKFDFFFLLGFLVQTVTLIVVPKEDPEFALSIAGIFVALAAMCMAIYCAKVENKLGTIAIVVAYVGSAVYLSYKLAVLSTKTNYVLIVFAAITIVMVLCTIIMSIVCLASFDKGLKAYTMPQQKLLTEADDIYLYHIQNYSYNVRASRLELE
ncbi:Golgi apparatus membrane protein [Apiospora kogelbergensis]|uniref:Golgi apparatus membrane protein n=1 Tax=Apiospora kogelbergensis TaxID=1337665 RepID=UPI0031316A94